MNRPPTVLVFTCAEYGQANVNLALSYELALAGVNVCISSLALLKSRVQQLQEFVDSHQDPARSGGISTGSITFRECKGISTLPDVLKRHGLNTADVSHPHGVFGALQSYSLMDISVLPWSPEEHLAAIESAKEVIAAIKPDVVVVDKLFCDARDACRMVGQRFITMHPTSVKDVAMHMQPYLASFWKYPIVSSGFPYPLEWWQVPLNIYLYLRLIWKVMTSATFKKSRALRSSLGVKPMSPFDFYDEAPNICAGLPDIDLPLSVIPEQLISCGPIVMPFDPVEKSDPALNKWLSKGPTVLINLGSHLPCDRQLAREMASAFRILLDYHDRKSGRRIQVLWKAKASDDSQDAMKEIIGREMKEGRVKVVAWLEAEPVSILQHPNVVCTVHHGGANSFYEGVWSGLPHIVLPVWYDTYDYATRAEYLNIGIFGSKTSAPGVRADEFGKALVRVTGDGEEARRFRSAAKHFQEVCRVKGNGRELACAVVLKELGMTK